MTALEVLQVLAGAWAAFSLGWFVLATFRHAPAPWFGDPEAPR